MDGAMGLSPDPHHCFLFRGFSQHLRGSWSPILPSCVIATPFFSFTEVLRTFRGPSISLRAARLDAPVTLCRGPETGRLSFLFCGSSTRFSSYSVRASCLSEHLGFLSCGFYFPSLSRPCRLTRQVVGDAFLTSPFTFPPPVFASDRTVTN